AKNRLPIYNPKVNRFSVSTLIRSHLFQRYSIYTCCGGAVDVMSRFECIQHVFVLTERGHQAEFNLRVIGRYKDIPLLSWNKSLPDLPPPFRANRNVLQVWVGRAQPSRGCDRLVVRGMD